MMPVLVPTLLAAVAVMAVSLFFGSPALKRKSARGAGAANGSVSPAGPAVDAPNLVGSTARTQGTDLDFAFRRRLDGFALDVAWRTSARRLAILGASGSGKSMTLRLIAGLDRAEAATLRLEGRDLSDLPAGDPQHRLCSPELRPVSEFAGGATDPLSGRLSTL